METVESKKEDRLLTKDYVFCCLTNFLFYFSFYLVLPNLAMYVMDRYSAGGAVMGVVLASYIVSAMVIRPFSAFLVDTYQRKTLYLLSIGACVLSFLSYQVAFSLWLFVLCRVIHGLSFGMSSIAGNTIVIDVIPSSRRGEGLGYYGWSNNFAMAVGPMFGLWLHDTLDPSIRYDAIFYAGCGSTLLSLFFAFMIKTKYRPPVEHEAISFDRFLLIKGLPAGLNLILLSVTYSVSMNYLTLYTDEISLDISGGTFYLFQSVGIVVSRVFSGRLVDRGYLRHVIVAGSGIAIVAFLILALLPVVKPGTTLTMILFLLSALIIGIGYGTIFPAYNTLFVALAPNNRRGSATSTYLTSWEVGVGIGITLAGTLTSFMPLSRFYFIGVLLNVSAIVMFVLHTGPHFEKWRLS